MFSYNSEIPSSISSSNSGSTSKSDEQISGQVPAPGPLPLKAPTRVSIKEANDHLQLLHQRVSELEELLRKQKATLSANDGNHRMEIKQLKEAKEMQIEELTRAIVRLEERNKDLEAEVKEKTQSLEESQRKLLLLDSFLSSSLPSLEDLLIHLKQFNIKGGHECAKTTSASSFPSTSSLADSLGASIASQPITTTARAKCDLSSNLGDSGLPSATNSDSSRANSYNSVDHISVNRMGHKASAHIDDLVGNKQVKPTGTGARTGESRGTREGNKHRKTGRKAILGGSQRDPPPPAPAAAPAMVSYFRTSPTESGASTPSHLLRYQNQNHNQSNNHIIHKVGRSFSITSNFSVSEDEDPPPPPAPAMPSIPTKSYLQSSF